MIFKENNRILFTGDSITDCGRTKQGGDAFVLGDGYVRDVQADLSARFPELRLECLNTGISGNRVTDLAARWDRDVLELKPQHLVILIGTNDVWRHFDHPEWSADQQVSPDQFRETYQNLINSMKGKVRSLTLMTPFLVETNQADPMLIKMKTYAAIVRELAGQSYANLIDLQRVFDNFVKHGAPQMAAPDRVHPSFVGHRLIANAFLNRSLAGLFV
jgi:lysophospholipase L1-like esterase